MRLTGGYLNSRKIKTEKFENIKPTLSKIRQGIFNSLSSMVDFQEKIFLDMFAGSAVMSFEAISRGFNQVYTFEKDIKTFRGIKENFINLGIEYNLYLGDSLKLIKKISKTFDIIFIDPPYDSDLYEKTLFAIKENKFLNDKGTIILEYPVSRSIDFAGFKAIKQKQYGNTMITFLQCQK